MAFQQVGEREAEVPQPQVVNHLAIDKQAAAATQMLMLSLKVMSQRAIHAIGNIAVVGAIASAWLLWRDVLPAPTVLQLIGLGGYGLFILAAVYCLRR